MADERLRKTPPVHVDRRRFAFGAAATVALMPTLLAAQEDGADSDVLPDDTPDAAEPVRTVAAPEAPEPAAAGALRAAPGRLQLKPAPASETDVWCYGGAVPGPLLRVRQGDTFRCAFVNDLSQPSTLHWHGVHVPNGMDGVAGLTQTAVAPGQRGTIAFPVPDAGTYWYRPLVPALAAEQTERGLYGMLVVDEREPPPVDQDLALVLDDWALDERAQVRASFGDPGEVGLSGRLGNWLTVDSREPPRAIEVPAGARLRVRVLNAANARPFTLLFEGLTVNVVAVDGQPSEVFAPARGTISLVPGSRLDLMVDAPATTGAIGSVKVALGPGLPVLTVTTTSARSELAGRPVAPLPSNRLPKVIALEAAARAELVIEGGLDPAAIQGGARPSLSDPARAWTINRTAWPDAAAKPVLSVKAGRPVTLGLVNRTPFLQAMHIHGHHVRLLHNLDDGWEPYWLDTVPVPQGGTARIAFVAEAPGKWMVGSSILERLSGGLACWFEVT